MVEGIKALKVKFLKERLQLNTVASYFPLTTYWNFESVGGLKSSKGKLKHPSVVRLRMSN